MSWQGVAVIIIFISIGYKNRPLLSPKRLPSKRERGRLHFTVTSLFYLSFWSERLDSNQRPPAPKAEKLIFNALFSLCKLFSKCAKCARNTSKNVSTPCARTPLHYTPHKAIWAAPFARCFCDWLFSRLREATRRRTSFGIIFMPVFPSASRAAFHV